MKLGALVVGVVLLGVAGAARGDDTIPFNPFEKAAVGDWFAFRTTVTKDGKKDGDSTLVEVSAIDGDKVILKNGEGGSPGPFSRTKAPTIAQIVGGVGDGKIVDVKTKDDKVTRGGKEFDCKLLTFKLEGEESAEGSFWFCPEVKVLGFVTMKANGSGKQNAGTTIEMEVLGYGTKEKSLWGLTRAEAEKAVKAKRETVHLLDVAVTCSVKAVSLETALAELFKAAGGRFKAELSEGVDGKKKVSLDVKELTLEKALEKLLEGSGYFYEVQNPTTIAIKKTPAK